MTEEKLLRRDEVDTGVLNKGSLISYMAEVYGVSKSEAGDAYEMVINSIKDLVSRGMSLRLVGFGLFYLQKHKGNPIQFHAQTRTNEDYLVFKFSASSTLNRAVRKAAAERQGM